MPLGSLFEIKLADELNIKLAERLSLITILAAPDVAQKHARLKAAGLVSQDAEKLEVDVALLTYYLMQGSFTATVRALIKAVQLADRLQKTGRHKQRDLLISTLVDFLADLYSYKILSPEGEVLKDTGDEVLALFEEVCRQFFTSPESLAQDKLPQFLAEKQREFVRVVLERARRQTSTVESFGSNKALNEKLDSIVSKMEIADLDWALETYSIRVDNVPGKRALPNFDNQTQRAISTAVLMQILGRVRSFQEATSRGAEKKGIWSSVRKRIPLLGRKGIDLSQTNLLEAERFVVDLRLQVSYRQQITILGSLLDKVNEFSALLNSFEAVVSSVNRKAQAEHGKMMLEARASRNERLLCSGDPVDIALGELAAAGQRPLEADVELQQRLSKQDEELARSIGGLRRLFAQKTQTANKVLAKLTDLGNRVRAMAPMVVQEAQHKDAPFTSNLIEICRLGVEEILKIEGVGGGGVAGETAA